LLYSQVRQKAKGSAVAGLKFLPSSSTHQNHMESANISATRRTFVKAIAVAGLVSLTQRDGASAEETAAKKKTPLGIDNFAVRAMSWKADALIDYAASLKTD
jgi:hypothetical protein